MRYPLRNGNAEFEVSQRDVQEDFVHRAIPAVDGESVYITS